MSDFVESKYTEFAIKRQYIFRLGYTFFSTIEEHMSTYVQQYKSTSLSDDARPSIMGFKGLSIN